MRILLVLSLLLTFIPVTQAQDDAFCLISANFDEALGENHDSLFRILLLLTTRAEPLSDPSTIGLYHAQLVSIRQFHEDMVTELPECAQPVNQQFIATVTAAQDVITNILLLNLNPDFPRAYNNRLEQSREYLATAYEEWQTTTANIPLTTPE